LILFQTVAKRVLLKDEMDKVLIPKLRQITDQVTITKTFFRRNLHL